MIFHKKETGKNWFSGQTYVGQGVAGGLAGQGRAPGQPGVDFDDVVLLRLGVEGVLDVALADDAQVADDLDGARPEHVVFSVGSDRVRSLTQTCLIDFSQLMIVFRK